MLAPTSVARCAGVAKRWAETASTMRATGEELRVSAQNISIGLAGSLVANIAQTLSVRSAESVEVMSAGGLHANGRHVELHASEELGENAKAAHLYIAAGCAVPPPRSAPCGRRGVDRPADAHQAPSLSFSLW